MKYVLVTSEQQLRAWQKLLHVSDTGIFPIWIVKVECGKVIFRTNDNIDQVEEEVLLSEFTNPHKGGYHIVIPLYS